MLDLILRLLLFLPFAASSADEQPRNGLELSKKDRDAHYFATSLNEESLLHTEERQRRYLPHESERANLRAYDATIRSNIAERWHVGGSLVKLLDLPPGLAWANGMIGKFLAFHKGTAEPGSLRVPVTVTVMVRHPLTGGEIPVCPIPVSSLVILLKPRALNC